MKHAVMQLKTNAWLRDPISWNVYFHGLPTILSLSSQNLQNNLTTVGFHLSFLSLAKTWTPYTDEPRISRSLHKVWRKLKMTVESTTLKTLRQQQLLQWLLNSAAAAKSLQSCPTLCDPRNGSPPGSPVSGILQARTLEWVAISFSTAWKWKVKVKSLSRVQLLATPWTAALVEANYSSKIYSYLSVWVSKWASLISHPTFYVVIEETRDWTKILL